MESYYYVFFIILSIIFIVPNLLKKFNIPAITSIMIAGIIIGPYGLNILQVDETLKILADFGAIMLMFLAGLEVDNETLKQEFKNSLILSLFSLLIPGVGGYLIGQYLGLGFIGSLLYAVIFASHSVAIVYAILEELKMVKTRLGTIILSATIIVDLFTLLLLSVVIKLGIGGENVGTFLLETVLYIGVLLLAIPSLSKNILGVFEKLHAQRIHYVLFIIFIAIIVGEVIGIHPIVGAFICGVAVSEALTKEEHDELLNKNLNAIGYGFFIPIFFLVLGMETNIRVIFNLSNLELLLITLISAVALKFISGFIALRILGFDRIKNTIGGLLTVPKISASLVAASIGRELGLIGNEIFVTIVALSVITATITPIVVKHIFVAKCNKKAKN
ncbi:TPA: cation:proton antiporter [Methanocaldococcus jannaschii]|uniref:Probable Na(+)/H(+) antiporter 3 n=2 Tax=Methanocaldococcus jannaschii TaxID=2190 RepID=NAH3_METJA|nr:cation:proton antiporter [Methanocaldococcus jannaschii]Q58671.1 RecName: Full=Probable Na(+)/H(+) antiporter 3; AltName: Full=MjNapA [Methanocaldococcus jannaschii DSM 2661]AAB99281.1 NA(+)/H(+) antiporter (napA) [Methanocaldococcus jannaschii DSM 2661]HII60094.1 cation:proton antiporter [Methanocaldococcus jannaschii]